VVAGAGSYPWSASAAPGFDFSGPSSGSATIVECKTPPPPPPPPPPSFQNVLVSVSGGCSTIEGRLGLADLLITVDPAGGATVTVNGQQFTGNAALLGLADATTYVWTAVPNSGYALLNVGTGSVVIPECDVAVLGTVVETTVPAVSAETLPFTGFEAGQTIIVGLLALFAGGVFLMVGKRDDEEPVTASRSRWSD